VQYVGTPRKAIYMDRDLFDQNDRRVREVRTTVEAWCRCSLRAFRAHNQGAPAQRTLRRPTRTCS